MDFTRKIHEAINYKRLINSSAIFPIFDVVGISSRQLAATTGLDPTSISQWKSSKKDIPLYAMIVLLYVALRILNDFAVTYFGNSIEIKEVKRFALDLLGLRLNFMDKCLDIVYQELIRTVGKKELVQAVIEANTHILYRLGDSDIILTQNTIEQPIKIDHSGNLDLGANLYRDKGARDRWFEFVRVMNDLENKESVCFCGYSETTEHDRKEQEEITGNADNQ